MNKIWITALLIMSALCLLGALLYGLNDEWSRATFNLLMGGWFHKQALEEIEKI